MTGDETGFAEISDVHRKERQSGSLTKLPNDFYERSEAYLAKLRETYDTECKNPSSPKAMMLQDEIKKTEKRIKQIYEMREGKIAHAALACASGSAHPDNMTKRDKALFDELVEALSFYRYSFELRAPKSRVQEKVEISIMPKMECQTQFVEPKDVAPQQQVIPAISVVHVLEDLPPFAGVDHTYNLKKDDVISLPAQYASLLSSKGKVKIVEG
jgi:DNA replication initiation complex subunit (GINS family)